MTQEDPFIEEVRRLKREAAERSPTREQLAERLREIEKERADKVVVPPKQDSDAA